MTSEERILGYLGLAEKGKNLVSGEFSAEKAVKSGKAFLVVVAEDASDNTKKHFSDMCTYYEVPYFTCSDRARIGHAVGKELRASVAVTEGRLAKAILSVHKKSVCDGEESSK